MSKRHWLRDEISFGMLGERRPHYSIVSDCTFGDDCNQCNRAAQEIADSIALNECDHETADYGVTNDRLNDWAIMEFGP